jgi:hypothetical protein
MIGVVSLLQRIERARDRKVPLTVRDALDLAEALRERLPDDVALIGFETADPGETAVEVSDLCGAIVCARRYALGKA